MSDDETTVPSGQTEKPPPKKSWLDKLKLSRLRRKRRHAGDDKAHPVDRLQRWAVLHPFTAAVLAMGVIYVPAAVSGAYVVNCIIDYNHDYYVADNARSEAAAAVDKKRRELDSLNLKIYTQNAEQEDYDAYRAGLRKLVELSNAQIKTQEEKPLPEYPGGLCGLSVR